MRRYRNPGIPGTIRISLVITSFVTAALLTGAGCSGFGDIFQSPKATIDSIEIVGADFSSVSLLVNVEIDNPNALGITLSAYDYALDVDGSRVVDGRREEPASLKAGGVSVIPIPLNVTFRELAAAGTSVINNNEIPLSLGLGLEITLPYMGIARLDLSGGIDIPVLRPPIIRPSSIKVNELSLTGAQVSMILNVENPNSFDITINSMSGSLWVDGREWGAAGAESGAWLPEGGNVVLVLKAGIYFSEVGRSVWSLLSGSGNAEVQLEGVMDLEMGLDVFKGREVPWDADAKVSILR